MGLYIRRMKNDNVLQIIDVENFQQLIGTLQRVLLSRRQWHSHGILCRSPARKIYKFLAIFDVEMARTFEGLILSQKFLSHFEVPRNPALINS